MGKSKTGTPTEYAPADEAALEAAVEEAWANYVSGDEDDEPDASDWFEDLDDDEPTPTKITITADIEWAGTFNPTAHRTTTLRDLDLGAVRAAAARAAEATTAARAARPLASYRATGWHAQIKALTGTRAGQAAADRAGINVTPRTLLAWLGDERTPTRANQDRIAQAYAEIRDRPLAEARARATAAHGEVAHALTAAVREAYGAEVRFFNISHLEFGA
jgi:hypothetical protein